MNVFTDDLFLAEAAATAGEVFAWHLRLDLGGCDPRVLDKPAQLAAWALELCERIGMTPFGEPIVDCFGNGRLAGLTLVQRIEESAIIAHTAFGRGLIADVVSCKEFEPATATGFTVSFFGARRVRSEFLTRSVPGEEEG